MAFEVFFPYVRKDGRSCSFGDLCPEAKYAILAHLDPVHIEMRATMRMPRLRSGESLFVICHSDFNATRMALCLTAKDMRYFYQRYCSCVEWWKGSPEDVRRQSLLMAH